MKRLYRVMFGILALSVLLLSGCSQEGPGKAAESSPTPEAVESSPAPEAAGSSQVTEAVSEPPAVPVRFEGRDLEGNAFSSDLFSQSRLTMINVWATYCNPCLREMPDLGQLAAQYDAGDFQLIGVISDVLEGTDQALAESLVRQTGADYPHLLLNESIYYALLANVSAVPTTFFLDQEGIVVDVVIGARDKPAWEAKINELLEKQ